MPLKPMHLLFIRRLFLLIVLSFTFTIQSKELVPISGDISNITFDTIQQYYWVKETIEVPSGKSVKIPAGIVLMFDIKTSFRILGNCEIEGTENNPVNFTSVKDSIFPVAFCEELLTKIQNDSITYGNFQPTGDDWDGIYVVGNHSRIVFHNVHLRFTQLPLTIDSACDSVILEGVSSAEFGKLDFLTDKKWWEVPVKPQLIPKDTQSVKTVVPAIKPIVWYKSGKVRWTLGVTGIVTALAGGGCLAGAYVNYQDYQKEYDIYYGLTGADIERKTIAKQNYVKSFNKSDNFKKAALITGITAGIFLTSLGVTFLF